MFCYKLLKYIENNEDEAIKTLHIVLNIKMKLLLTRFRWQISEFELFFFYYKV